jgi:hypothetical protein
VFRASLLPKSPVRSASHAHGQAVKANSEGVRDLIADLIAKDCEAIAKLWSGMLDALGEALAAETVVRRSDGVRMTVPDHRVRLKAVNALISLLSRR